MFFWSQVTFLLFLPLISAHPVLERSNNAGCNKFATVQSGSYTLNTNLWGSNNANSGSQCTHLLSTTGDIMKWYTTWEWDGGSTVKSYSNVQLDAGINEQLSAITSMPSVWKWTYSDTKSIVANVAYDFFTSYSAGGSNAVEIMVWVGNYGAGPISYAYGASGNAVPIEENLSIASHEWNLYLGNNGYNDVYSYVSASGNINSFSGDMYGFFSYLIKAGRLSSSQYLTIAEAGTEATSGSGLFDTTEYSLKINT